MTKQEIDFNVEKIVKENPGLKLSQISRLAGVSSDKVNYAISRIVNIYQEGVRFYFFRWKK